MPPGKIKLKSWYQYHNTDKNNVLVELLAIIMTLLTLNGKVVALREQHVTYAYNNIGGNCIYIKLDLAVINYNV